MFFSVDTWVAWYSVLSWEAAIRGAICPSTTSALWGKKMGLWWFGPQDYAPTSPPKGRGTYCFWCRSRQHRRWHQRESFLCAPYLMNQLADFNQICMDITLGHDEELIRFWWPWQSTRNLLKCYRTFFRQTEIFCRTERKSAGQKKFGFSLSQHFSRASPGSSVGCASAWHATFFCWDW